MAAQTFDSKSYPYGAVVLIDVFSASGGGPGWHGTGVLISPDEVLTASHIAFNSNDGLATDIAVAPGYQGGAAPFGVLTGTVTHYNPVSITGGNITYADSQGDYAVIHLSHPVTGAPVMAVTPGFAGGPVHVTGYPDSAGGATMVDDVQTVAKDPALTLLRGSYTGTGSSGGPVWSYGPDGKPQVVGLVSSGSATYNTGNDVQITQAAAAQIAAWVQQDDAGLAEPAPYALPVASLAIYDATAKQAMSDTLSTPFTGGLPFVAEQYVSVSPHSLNIAAASPNYFIHTGAGNDAVQLLGGTNVVDAGAGSNLLTGGALRFRRRRDGVRHQPGHRQPVLGGRAGRARRHRADAACVRAGPSDGGPDAGRLHHGRPGVRPGRDLLREHGGRQLPFGGGDVSRELLPWSQVQTLRLTSAAVRPPASGRANSLTDIHSDSFKGQAPEAGRG